MEVEAHDGLAHHKPRVLPGPVVGKQAQASEELEAGVFAVQS